jgi:hypothetical protein
MLVILFDVGETKKKKIQVQACAKIDLFRICADRNEEFVQMYIHLHLWSLPFSLSLPFTTTMRRLSSLDIVVTTSVESNFKAISTLAYIQSPTKIY